MLIMLSVFLMPICILASWDGIQKRVGEYMAAFLVMELLMIGVFAAQDLFLFYIFFEAGLIPMYLIIGVWGGDNRIYASYKFFLYTLLGSVVMLIAMMWMVNQAGTSAVAEHECTTVRIETGRLQVGSQAFEEMNSGAAAGVLRDWPSPRIAAHAVVACRGHHISGDHPRSNQPGVVERPIQHVAVNCGNLGFQQRATGPHNNAGRASVSQAVGKLHHRGI